MADIGYRRKGDGTPLYNPERDYAYITPTLMRVAIENLESSDPPERATWRLEHDVHQAEIIKLTEALAKAQSDFVNSADPVKSFEAALERHGFFDFRYEIRQYLFSVMGEVFCAAWFKAVREVSIVNEESPAAADMARFTAEVRKFAAGADLPVSDVNYVAEYRHMQSRILQGRLNEASEDASKYKTAYYDVLDQLNKLKLEKALERKQSVLSRIWGALCGVTK
jgi:hypothetical protein